MKKLSAILLLSIIVCTTSIAQNVGIGTSTPTGPLSFASQLGNKIVLWGDGNAAHYGLGIQGSTLQLYADAFNSNISFGYGRSGAFTERARIYNSGIEGMYLNGRLHLRNGDPANLGGGGGIWLYNPTNTTQIGFMGTQNSQNIGFYGGNAGWGFTYNIINSRVGIGNENPNAPLAFGPTLGKKITLYPGATGDVGFGVAGNRLQIYSDNQNADVAIGWDGSGFFNERFAVKPNGALAVVGNTGTAGQMIQSNGAGAAASWSSPSNWLYNNIQVLRQPGNAYTISANATEVVIPGLETGAYSINLPSANNRIILNFTTYFGSTLCTFCNYSYASFNVRVFRNGLLQGNFIDNAQIVNGTNMTYSSGVELITGGAGTYTFSVSVNNGNTHNISVFASRLFIAAIPQ